jgi:hypothetical protein
MVRGRPQPKFWPNELIIIIIIYGASHLAGQLGKTSPPRA